MTRTENRHPERSEGSRSYQELLYNRSTVSRWVWRWAQGLYIMKVVPGKCMEARYFLSYGPVGCAGFRRRLFNFFRNGDVGMKPRTHKLGLWLVLAALAGLLLLSLTGCAMIAGMVGEAAPLEEEETPTVEATITRTSTPRPTATATATETPTPTPTVSLKLNSRANIRTGPGKTFRPTMVGKTGDEWVVYGRSADGEWLLVDVENYLWVHESVVWIDVNIADLPLAPEDEP
jgi:hypothetical protein